MDTDHGYVIREELENTEKRLSKDIRENRDRINEHSKDIARLNTLYDSLEGLPAAITALDKTLYTMGENMNAMNEKINDVNESIQSLRKADEQRDNRINEIDNKSKIDWQKAITNNFWKIISACLAAAVVIKLLVENLGG